MRSTPVPLYSICLPGVVPSSIPECKVKKTSANIATSELQKYPELPLFKIL